MLKTFPGGEHITGFKELTKNEPIEDFPLLPQVVIPLSQHAGSACEALVKQGDKVKTGTKIGSSTGFVSSTIHASISGIVSKIADEHHPVLGRCRAIIIESDGKDEKDASIKVPDNINTFNKDELLTIIKEAGIVGLGGAAFPTHVKLKPPKTIDALLINGVECEPFLTCDLRLMLEKSEQIIRGIIILQKILDAKLVCMGIEHDKPEAIQQMRNKVKEMDADIRIFSLKTKYPQGAEKQLIKAILGREVPAGKLPFDVGVVAHNVGTAYAVFEAVYEGKPLYERVITVTGKILRKRKNLRVRIGSKVSEIIDFCGGTSQAIKKIIIGGPLMGLAQFSAEIPVIKGTSGILVLSGDETKFFMEQPCIRCGKCVRVCPVRMLPYALSLCGQLKSFETALQYNPFDCIECGLCSYVCPAKRKILEYIRLIKIVLR
ncbi:MAG: electron transport complex subunit RsxC [Gammaproteobacteria bacterium]|nr:electron transport complex subunit RsxC [Gammaproteobacteria bacterium]